jgi:hypothetical protein
MHLTHAEIIEYRKRSANINIKRDEAMDAERAVRRWLQGILTKYNVEGERYHIDIDTGEIVIHHEGIPYQSWQSVFNAELAAKGQNIWNGHDTDSQPGRDGSVESLSAESRG